MTTFTAKIDSWDGRKVVSQHVEYKLLCTIAQPDLEMSQVQEELFTRFGLDVSRAARCHWSVTLGWRIWIPKELKAVERN